MAQAKRKKRFFDVDMPVLRGETQLIGYDVEELEGRIIKYDLTRILKGKSMMLELKVRLEEGKPTSIPIRIELMPYFLRRMVRKGTNYVEDSFFIECRDAELRIKPFLVTRRKVSRRIRAALRNKLKEEIINYIKGREYVSLFEDILRNQMQRTLSMLLKKVYPLSLCEIRILEVIKEKENPDAGEKESKPKKREEEPKVEEIAEIEAAQDVSEEKAVEEAIKSDEGEVSADVSEEESPAPKKRGRAKKESMETEA
jgi:ribosomal protein S3AE